MPFSVQIVEADVALKRTGYTKAAKNKMLTGILLDCKDNTTVAERRSDIERCFRKNMEDNN